MRALSALALVGLVLAPVTAWAQTKPGTDYPSDNDLVSVVLSIEVDVFGSNANANVNDLVMIVNNCYDKTLPFLKPPMSNPVSSLRWCVLMDAAAYKLAREDKLLLQDKLNMPAFFSEEERNARLDHYIAFAFDSRAQYLFYMYGNGDAVGEVLDLINDPRNPKNPKSPNYQP